MDDRARLMLEPIRYQLANGNKFKPTRAHDTDIGIDLYLPKPVMVMNNEPTVISLDIIVRPPQGYYFMLCLRSSTAAKKGLSIPNGFGVIDPTYCGPEDVLKLIVVKTIPGIVKLDRGEKVAQLVLNRAYVAHFVEDSEDFYKRKIMSRGGIGSTGE